MFEAAGSSPVIEQRDGCRWLGSLSRRGRRL